jgi:hypothetical protein
MVPISAIGDAGRAAAGVATDMAGIDVATPAQAIAAALPGSRSAQVAAAAAEQWRTEFAGVTTALQEYGRGLGDTAVEYSAAEQAQLRQIAQATALMPGAAGVLGSAALQAAADAAGSPSLIRQALG